MATKPTKEEILAKAAAKLDEMKSAKTIVAPAAPQKPVASFAPTVRFWCAHSNHEVYLTSRKEVKFVGNEYITGNAEEVRQLRELVKLYPYQFKELA